MKKLLILFAAGLMVTAFILGCSTEEPWQPDPVRPLQLSFVSGPADTVAYGSSVSFSWTSQGGVGEVQYQYRLNAGNWSTASNVTSITYHELTDGDYTFDVRATDEANAQVEVTRSFTVDAALVDAVPPTVTIIDSPIPGSFVATGRTIAFTWDGSDDVDNDNVLFQYYFAGTTSEWAPARTVTFSNVQAANPAIFWVKSKDQSDNESVPDSVSFVIKDANILYVDDFQWLDAGGNVDMPKERDQKNFYRQVLEGYAFAEWDVAAQGMPDSSDLVVGGEPVYSTIVWCSDSDVGSSDGTWWYEVGAVGGGVIRHYLESGGNLLVAGPLVLPWMYNTNPPTPGDLEYDWFGIDSTGGSEGLAWDYWWWFTWAVKDSATTLNLPDSMKIDVAKQANQDDYAAEIIHFRDDATVTSEVLFKWGLWVDGQPPLVDPDNYPHPYNWPVGHITKINDTPRTAMLNFDAYSMPLSDIRQTFGAILAEFGE